MTLDKAVLSFAGLVVLTGTVLAALVSPWWLLLTGFAAVNMLQASLTGFCPAAMVFRALGVRPGTAFN